MAYNYTLRRGQAKTMKINLHIPAEVVVMVEEGLTEVVVGAAVDAILTKCQALQYSNMYS